MPSWNSRRNSRNFFFTACKFIWFKSCWSSEEKLSEKKIPGSSKPSILEIFESSQQTLPSLRRRLSQHWPALMAGKVFPRKSWSCALGRQTTLTVNGRLAHLKYLWKANTDHTITLYYLFFTKLEGIIVCIQLQQYYPIFLYHIGIQLILFGGIMLIKNNCISLFRFIKKKYQRR